MTDIVIIGGGVPEGVGVFGPAVVLPWPPAAAGLPPWLGSAVGAPPTPDLRPTEPPWLVELRDLLGASAA